MNTSHLPLTILLIVATLLGSTAKAQSPTPIIVQAANASATTATSTSPKGETSATDAQSILTAIKQLEQIKAANDEVLAKQKAALQRLDELKDAAEQLQIFAKRG